MAYEVDNANTNHEVHRVTTTPERKRDTARVPTAKVEQIPMSSAMRVTIRADGSDPNEQEAQPQRTENVGGRRYSLNMGGPDAGRVFVEDTSEQPIMPTQ